MRVCYVKPLIFGASISAGYRDISDGIAAKAKLTFGEKFGGDYLYFGTNHGPITRLANEYNPKAEITNISEMINQMPFSSIGPDQFKAYISKPKGLKNARSSSVLASIDGLYWATIYGPGCGATEYALEGMSEVIQFGRKHNIPVIVGNVPQEDPSKVLLLLKGGGPIPANWNEPQFECLEMVDQFLKQECKLENQCYIVDFRRVVKNIEGNLGPHDREGIAFEGKNYLYNDFRQDGVHLWNSPPFNTGGSDIPNGMRYLMTYIKKSIAWNLPECVDSAK